MGGSGLVVCEVGRKERFSDEEGKHVFVVNFNPFGRWLIVRFLC